MSESSGQPPFSVKRAAKLGLKKHREAERLFLAEGEAVIQASKKAPQHLFTEPEQTRRISNLKTSTSPVGVFSFVDVSPERLFEVSERVVLLHEVQDPGNVGTVVRSAHAFGAGVALSRGCADLYNPKTVRATMGAIFEAPVSRELDSVEFLETAKKSGFASVAATVEGGEEPGKSLRGKLVVVVGSEGSGLPEEVVRACDERVTIPSAASSINAAVAASILLYDAYYRVLT